MAFDFDKVFADALNAGLDVAKSGGKAAQDWVEESANANADTLRAIADGVLSRQISKETGSLLLQESARALRSEANALAAILKATAQAGINAFIDSLFSALKSALKLSL